MMRARGITRGCVEDAYIKSNIRNELKVREQKL